MAGPGYRASAAIPQNVAIAAARQGASAGYLTRLGQDWMGDAFLELWKSEGVDASCVSRHPTAPTGVSFVTHTTAGHKFDYLRKNSAASLMTPDDLPRDYIAGARFLHVSAIGQAISGTAREACDAAIACARAPVSRYPTTPTCGSGSGTSTPRATRSTRPSRSATSCCRVSTIRSS
jgi:sugar/nucleoside kinase (ribokinase family)